MLFGKLFGKKRNAEAQEQEKTTTSVSAPEIAYVHTANNRERTQASEYDVLVINWIGNKKKGYDSSKKSYPKWFMNTYGIDFDSVMSDFIGQGLLSEENNIITVTPEGYTKLQQFDYVIYVYSHPQYCLTLDDFKNAQNLHKVQLNDIAWGIFNQRTLTYIEEKMWSSLAANYANMADLLINEKKYEQALDFIFGTAYLETSGMRDDNELADIMTEYTKNGIKDQYLKNGMPDIFLLEINNYYVTVPFNRIQDQLGLDWPKVKKLYLNSQLVASLESILPFRYFEKEQSFEIFKQAIEEGGTKGIFRLEECKKKLKWNDPDKNSTKYFYASPENKAYRLYPKRQ